MGLVLQEFIEAPSIYACVVCKAHIARRDDVISRTFQGRLGRAYLTESVVNEKLGNPEDRLLMTGMHTVCNLQCCRCDALIGWKYIHAHDRSQQYKEGRYVLEQARIFSVDDEDLDDDAPGSPLPPLPSQQPGNSISRRAYAYANRSSSPYLGSW